MPFGDYKTLADAIEDLQVTEISEEFVTSVPLAVSETFQSDLRMTLDLYDVECSEWAVCEMLIFPVLKEVLRPHATVLGLWSHVSLYHEGRLLGVPDYLIGKRSPLSKRVVGKPLAMIMEAKRNDFDAGWGQCLAAMMAARLVNGDPEQTVYGCVSDGFIWRFGKLQGSTFSRHPQDYTLLTRLEELFGALNHVLELCKQQVLAAASAA